MTIIPLSGYKIRYARKGIFFIPKILVQLPKILRAIKNEHRWLSQQLPLHHWDLVISDNRYGLYSSNTKTVFITHQLGVISGMGKWGDTLLRLLLYRWINRFGTCWIPDTAGKINIAGKLSHPQTMPRNHFFIGPLSRLNNSKTSEGNHLLMMLSGPEPQRSMLENKLIEQLKQVNEQVIFVRGIPSTAAALSDSENIRFENHLDGDALSTMVSSAKAIVCRSGYSSVMDLLKLNKKALLIPTPGQTEQVYLAKHLQEMKWFMAKDQDALDLHNDLKVLLSEKLDQPTLDFDGYKKAFAQLGIQ